MAMLPTSTGFPTVLAFTVPVWQRTKLQGDPTAHGYTSRKWVALSPGRLAPGLATITSRPHRLSDITTPTSGASPHTGPSSQHPASAALHSPERLCSSSNLQTPKKHVNLRHLRHVHRQEQHVPATLPPPGLLSGRRHCGVSLHVSKNKRRRVSCIIFYNNSPR